MTTDRGRIVRGLAGLGLWVALLSFPHDAVPGDPDSGWQRALGFAYLGGPRTLRAGSELVFTLGPLGYFWSSAFDERLFHAKLAWEFALKLVLALLLLGPARRTRGRAERALASFALVFVAAFTPDALYLLAIVATALGASRGTPSRARLGLGVLLLAVLANVKLTYLALGALAAPALGARRGGASAGLALAAFLGAFAAVFAATGQSLADLPPYLATSLELVRGYSAGMGARGRGPELALGLACALGFAVFAACQESRGRAARLLLVASAALAWKQGFVRHDAHALAGFGFFAFAPFLVHPGEPTRRARGARALLALAGAAGFLLASHGAGETPVALARDAVARVLGNAATLARLGRFHEERLARAQALSAAQALPRVREAVGAATIDALALDPAVLLANGLAWRPRPAFQGYLAYTEALAAANGAVFEGESAPDFALVKLGAVDRHLPSQEDGLALLAVLRRYEPVLLESSYLLARRRPRVAPGESRLLLDRAVAFGEPVSLPAPGGNGSLLLELSVRSSVRGGAAQLLLRAPEVWLELEDATGTTRTGRIVPATAASPFLVSPLLGDQDELVRWLSGEPVFRPSRLRLTLKPDWPGCFEPAVRLRVLEDPALVPDAATNRARLGR